MLVACSIATFVLFVNYYLFVTFLSQSNSPVPHNAYYFFAGCGVYAVVYSGFLLSLVKAEIIYGMEILANKFTSFARKVSSPALRRSGYSDNLLSDGDCATASFITQEDEYAPRTQDVNTIG